MRALLIVFLLAVSLPVLAQDAEGRTDSELFNAGVAAIADQRFGDARDLLQRALAISPRTATAFNLAIALRGTGEFSEGVRILEALRTGDFGRLEDAQVEQVDILRRELTPSIAQLRVEAEGATLRIDTETQPEGEWVRLDPGTHVVEAEAEGFQPLVQRVELSSGERRTLEVTLVANPVERRSRAWIWVLVGVVAAGGAALALGLTLRSDPAPRRDPVFGNTMALSW